MGSDVPAISIITPTFNRRAALVRAIDSVRAQTLSDYEHIIVDDGSTDGSGAAVAAFGDPRIVYLAMPGWSGANAARNAGIAKARAPIVTFLDSDDAFLPQRLETSLAHFARDPSLDLVISSFRKQKRDGMADGTNPRCMVCAEALELVLVAQTIFIAGSAITVRKEALAAIGGFDPQVMRLQDRELLLRMSQRHGALLSDAVDWIKYETDDSISGKPDGYVEAYAALMARHPRIAAAFPSIGPYMVARRIFANILRGRLAQGSADYRTNRASPVLGYTPGQLVSGYFRGKGERRRARRALAVAVRAGIPEVGAKVPEPERPEVAAGPADLGIKAAAAPLQGASQT